MKYGEILFIGKCNLDCYYCLKKEMNKISVQPSQMNIHFSLWNNFNKFIQCLKKESIGVIYLSSTCTEPMMYRFLKELIEYLQYHGFKVGIRTNGYFAETKSKELAMFDEEISFSIQSLNPNTNQQICNVNYIPNWNKIFHILKNNHKKCRISIVINQYNVNEILEIIKYLNDYSDVISYVQLRRIYKYYEEKESKYYFEAIKQIKNIGIKEKNFYESEQYKVGNLIISFWSDVFNKSSIQSINYFTDGLITTNNLLVPAYEENI